MPEATTDAYLHHLRPGDRVTLPTPHDVVNPPRTVGGLP